MPKKSRIEVGNIYKMSRGTSVEVIEYLSWDRIKVRFLDEHGTTRWCQSSHIYTGVLKNPFDKSHNGVGFLGEGVYGTESYAYEVWRSMIKRCYNKKYQKGAPLLREMQCGK